ncbi:gap-Pol polyprotein [Clonorchis sinensis]|uniref:Gap-Pol polyprotein n=1 Tax=Clonorchis sinensis TaxID=79923 RepID=G7Y959_CLOSI|nr:gap-Pol polyprotein [Clonorchis sinensis]
MRRFKTARMSPGSNPTVFPDSLRESSDRALPGLDRASCQKLLSDQFVEGVQPALGAQLRLAGAAGQLSVRELVNLARGLAETPLATLQSQEKRDGSPVDELRTTVDQLAEQLAAIKTKSRRSHFSRDAKRIYEKTYCSHASSIVSTVTLVVQPIPLGGRMGLAGGEREPSALVIAVAGPLEWRDHF